MSTAPTAFQIRYETITPKDENRWQEVNVSLPHGDYEALVERGYIVMRGLLSAAERDTLSQALDELRRALPMQIRLEDSNRAAGALYLRKLESRHSNFRLLICKPILRALAQACLGPRIRFDELVVRYGCAETPDIGTGWHIHHPVVPKPLPPFFSYPHALHGVAYLDEARFIVLPGSHADWERSYSGFGKSSVYGEVPLTLGPGDCVLFHANLWHRSDAPKQSDQTRRCLIFGYHPAWVIGDERGGNYPDPEVSSPVDEDPEVKTLTEKFYWK